MKILHVITSLRTGGAEKLMVDLLPRLKAKGFDVDLLLFDGVDTPFRRQAEAAGIRIFDFGNGGLVYSPAKLFKLMPYLRKYDVVHTHNTACQMFAAISNVVGTAKLITTEHGGSNRRRSIKVFKPIDRWMYKRYLRVICISKKAEENLRTYLGTQGPNILTVNNGVDVSIYAEALPSSELECIAPGSRKIISVAGFRWEKDQDTLIRSMKYLPLQFHLFLVGDGVRRPELEALVETENLGNRVHFLGVRTDVPELLHAADYVVMSSHFEGLSLSSVEGMSVGKPFLASDVDGLREVVNGAGILFPHQDAQALARELLALEQSSGSYRSVAEACYRRALQFDISKMAESYIKVYNSLDDAN